jgi:hypothetical protein
MSTMSSPSLEIVLTTAWAIWKARNDLVWNDHLSLVSEICEIAAGTALDYLESRDSLAVFLPRVADPETLKWLPPARQNYKLNLSCVNSLETSNSGVGVVITPFLPPGFSRVSARKTRQPELSRPVPMRAHRIKYSQKEGPRHISQGLTRFDRG